MSNGKGSIVLLTIMSVATLLVAVVGATFAYFGATMNNTEGQTKIEVTSGTLSTEYNGDSKLTNGYVNQGEVIATKEFTVTGIVTGSNNLNYEASLVVNNNTYLDGELAYTITSVNESNNGSPIAIAENITIPTGTSNIVLGSGTFAGPTTTGLIHKYVITITRVNTLDASVDKTFDARMYVSQATK